MQNLDKIAAYCRKHFPAGVPKVTEHQHYVPKRYLRSWCSGKRIAVKMKGGPPRLMGVRDVAEESWFYQFTELGLAELETLINYIDINDDYVRTVAARLLACSVVPQIARRIVKNQNDGEAVLMEEALRSNGLYDESSCQVYTVRYLAAVMRPEIADAGFELLRKEGGERVLTGIENAAWPYLDKLKAGRVRFMTQPMEAIHWVEYLYLQLFRTPKARETINDAVRQSGVNEDVARKISSYLAWVFAVKGAADVMRNFDKFEFALIGNRSSVNFVTGDAPFLGLTNITDSNFIFPVSPKYAFYFGRREVGAIPTGLRNPTADVIYDINNRLSKSCIRQVYAQEIDDLERLLI